jgi:hypothetical protein
MPGSASGSKDRGATGTSDEGAPEGRYWRAWAGESVTYLAGVLHRPSSEMVPSVLREASFRSYM